ncbi:MAG TPA: hypothetical protein VL442_04250 [Mucilaginibacter sp.]|nr:hypothetical protein [Mucilaginibacter sp.]
MKKTIYFLFALAVFVFVSTSSKAQQYKTNYQFALGLKFGGYENGVAGKYFLDNTLSLEGILGFRSHGAVATGLLELNVNFSTPGLLFYYGAGAHLGAVGSGVYKRFGGTNEYYDNGQLLFGIDGIVGVEYIIPNSPIAFSLDLDPRIELTGGPFVDLAPGLGIKYTF